MTMSEGEFQRQLTKIHERSRLREEELEGQWCTEERMQEELGYSKIPSRQKAAQQLPKKSIAK